jgi:hypothetical protein
MRENPARGWVQEYVLRVSWSPVGIASFFFWIRDLRPVLV